MAECTYKENLIRTTLYLITPALSQTIGRSRLYDPEYNRLFRGIED